MVQEKDNVLRIFEETKEAIIKEDSFKLNELSNQTINTASRTQDPDNIATAVVIYSIGKIIERKKYREFPEWEKLYKKIISLIDESIKAIKNNKDQDFRKSINSLREYIDKLSGKLKEYVQDVFRKAQINKASKIYEHGISMEKTADLLGITMYELALYAGQTDISNTSENKTIDVKPRIKLAMEMFE
jgi:hypothetical protein